MIHLNDILRESGNPFLSLLEIILPKMYVATTIGDFLEGRLFSQDLIDKDPQNVNENLHAHC